MSPADRSPVGSRVFRPSRARPVRLLLPHRRKMRAKPPSFVLVALGFGALILVGTVCLMLPAASLSGQATSFGNALFTATSAVCVTGLVVVDTATYWSGWGQAVILILIQLGGLGFMTSATIFLMVMRRRVGLREKILTSQSLGVEQYGGLMGLVRRVVLFSLGLEGLGASILFYRFFQDNPPGEAVWKAVFHAVSAFNNAGFDIMGEYRSLIDYQHDGLVIVTIAALIILGGISFIVLADWARARRFARLTMDSKIVLTVSAALLLGGAFYFLVSELNNPATIGNMDWGQKTITSLFLSITARTAGFSSVDIGSLTLGSLFFLMLLMIVGGASGSTAGGIKVNTFGILVFTALSTLRGKERPEAFGRQFLADQIHRATTLVMVFIGLVSIVTVLLSWTENQNLTDLVFETFSAFGTVGLSTGITPELSAWGRVIITFAMFVGRLGPMSLFSMMVARRRETPQQYPTALIRLG